MLIQKFRETYIAQSGDFGSLCRELLNRIPASKRVASLVFYGNPHDTEAYFLHSAILDANLCSVFGDSVPPCSYIAQKPLAGALILEVCLFEEAPETVIAYLGHSGIRYLTLENKYGKELITGGLVSAGITGNTFEQASSVFRKTAAVLIRENMPVNSIIRQWNYIGDITGYSGGMQNYHQFNLARSQFYDTAVWDNGYPAATATGITAGGVIVRVEAFGATSPAIKNFAINNTLQVAAHRYSAEVLAGHDKTLYAPRFERARLLGDDGYETVYVSGTAAIRGEKSVAETDVVEQTRITLENMINLYPGKAKPVFDILVIYLKYAQDYRAVKAFIDQHAEAPSTVYVEADMCREELLVEIEGVAGTTPRFSHARFSTPARGG
jgi:hypothetical protein